MIMVKIFKDGFFIGKGTIKVTEISKYENAGFRLAIVR